MQLSAYMERAVNEVAPTANLLTWPRLSRAKQLARMMKSADDYAATLHRLYQLKEGLLS